MPFHKYRTSLQILYIIAHYRRQRLLGSTKSRRRPPCSPHNRKATRSSGSRDHKHLRTNPNPCIPSVLIRNLACVRGVVPHPLHLLLHHRERPQEMRPLAPSRYSPPRKNGSTTSCPSRNAGMPSVMAISSSQPSLHLPEHPRGPGCQPEDARRAAVVAAEEPRGRAVSFSAQGRTFSGLKKVEMRSWKRSHEWRPQQEFDSRYVPSCVSRSSKSAYASPSGPYLSGTFWFP